MSNATLRFCAGADAAASLPGAYILQIDLVETAIIAIARQPPRLLPAGRYLYCGSANGPGDLRRAWHDTCGVASRFTGILIS